MLNDEDVDLLDLYDDVLHQSISYVKVGSYIYIGEPWMRNGTVCSIPEGQYEVLEVRRCGDYNSYCKKEDCATDGHHFTVYNPERGLGQCTCGYKLYLPGKKEFSEDFPYNKKE